MATPEISLPTRTVFITNLHTLRLPGGTSISGIFRPCNKRVVSPSVDNKTETAIVFPDGYIMGETCARTYLWLCSTCPCCNTILFSEEASNTDNTNIARTCHLLEVERRITGDIGDLEAADHANRASRRLIDLCGTAYWNGKITTKPEDYGLFRMYCEDQLQDDQVGIDQFIKRILNATRVNEHLSNIFDEMFAAASKGLSNHMLPPHRQEDIAEEDEYLRAPCHPLASILHQQMRTSSLPTTMPSERAWSSTTDSWADSATASCFSDCSSCTRSIRHRTGSTTTSTTSCGRCARNSARGGWLLRRPGLISPTWSRSVRVVFAMRRLPVRTLSRLRSRG